MIPAQFRLTYLFIAQLIIDGHGEADDADVMLDQQAGQMKAIFEVKDGKWSMDWYIRTPQQVFDTIEPIQSKPKPKKKLSALDLPLPFNSVEFRDAWISWFNHRQEIKKPLSSETHKSQLKTMGAMGEKKAIDAIRFTIDKGWQGLHEADSYSNKKTETNGKLTSRISRQDAAALLNSAVGKRN